MLQIPLQIMSVYSSTSTGCISWMPCCWDTVQPQSHCRNEVTWIKRMDFNTLEESNVQAFSGVRKGDFGRGEMREIGAMDTWVLVKVFVLGVVTGGVPVLPL